MTFSDVFQNAIAVFMVTYFGMYFFLILLGFKTYTYWYWLEYGNVLFEGVAMRTIFAFMASLVYIFWVYHP